MSRKQNMFRLTKAERQRLEEIKAGPFDNATKYEGNSRPEIRRENLNPNGGGHPKHGGSA